MLVTCCTEVHSQRSTACSEAGSHAGKVISHSLYRSGEFPSNDATLDWSTQPGKSASLIQLEGALTCARRGRVLGEFEFLQRLRRNEALPRSAHLGAVGDVQRAAHVGGDQIMLGGGVR
eukprot:scaffold84768_cov60-Phaeocystis_antarctica.AAC.3